MHDKKNNRISAEQNRAWIRKISFGGLLLSIGIVLPQVFHLTGGPTSGATFLPMHIPVLIAGLLLGPVFGAGIGAITPIISSMMTGMPPAARMPFMVAELAIYGLVAGLLYHALGLCRFRFPRRATPEARPDVTDPERLIGLYISLILAMFAGRVVYALSLLVMNRLFGLENADPASVWAAIVFGIIGIAIQIVIIPPIIFALQKGGLTNGLFKKGRPQAQ